MTASILTGNIASLTGITNTIYGWVSPCLIGDASNISGDISNIYGALSGDVCGDVSGVCGNISGIRYTFLPGKKYFCEVGKVLNVFNVLKYYKANGTVSGDQALFLGELAKTNGRILDILASRTGIYWFECCGDTGVWPIDCMTEIAHMPGEYSTHFANTSYTVVWLADTREYCDENYAYH